MLDFPEFIRALPAADLPFDGVSGTLLQGENHQVVFIEFEKDVDVPEHNHRAQWELVIAGSVRLSMEGKERTYKPGEGFYIPEGVGHGASVSAGYKAIIFFDQADRYRAL